MDKMKEQKKWIGLNIYYYRRKRNLNQYELAERVQISSRHLSAIENGRKNTTLHVLYRIADVLEIPVSKLFEEGENANGCKD